MIESYNKFTPLYQETFSNLLRGAKQTGSFKEGLMMVEEELLVSEPWQLIEDFCIWLDEEVGGAGPVNIEQLWLAFNNQEDPLQALFIQETQAKMAMYNNL